MGVRGWVYVITNQAMPEIVKVGFSTKDPALRAKEFDGAALPYPYEVAYDVLVQDPYAVEQAVHRRLEVVRENKEWFRCTVQVAIEEIRNEVGDSAIAESVNVALEIDFSHFDGEMTCQRCGTINMAKWYSCRSCNALLHKG